MQQKKSRAYYQYMLDLADNKVSYFSTDEFGQIIYDLLDDGDATQAMAACQKGLDQHPGDEYLELVEAKILMQLNHLEESKKLLNKNSESESPFGIGIRFGLECKTKDPRDAFQTLFEQLQRGRLTALEYVEIIDEQFDHLPHYLTAHYLLMAATHVDNDTQKSDQLDAEALGRMGALLMDCNCHREAIEVLEQALDMDAYDVYSWQDLARCQFELQMFDECRNSCEMGIAVDPENPLFNFALGYILFQNDEKEAAIEHLEVARRYAEGTLQHEELHLERHEVEQQTSITYELLGAAYQSMGQLDKARQCYEVLIERIPSYAEGYYHLSMLSLEKGDTPKALQEIQQAIELAPDNTTYRTLCVTIQTDMHFFDDALKGLDALIKINPKSKTYLLAKAELAMSLKRFGEADTAYRSLLKLKPKDATSRSLLRAYFEAIGDEEALKKLK